MISFKHVKCYQKNYPRPQFVREKFTLLDGRWDFAFDFENVGEREGWYARFPADAVEIQVPYAYQCKASGVNRQERCDNVWYRRELGKIGEPGKRTLLNFEGVDYVAKVWVNGTFIGTHTGGYARFTFDITDALVSNGKNVLTVKAEDGYDTDRPRGKQRWADRNFGCWYDDTTGIWKSVWSENVDVTHIVGAAITPDYDGQAVTFDLTYSDKPKDVTVEAVVEMDGKRVAAVCAACTGKTQRLTVSVRSDLFEWGIIAWRPLKPALYDVTLVLRNGKGEIVDKVGSYFGLRKIEVRNNKVWLNNEGLYFKMLLDQGYWSDTVLTPPDEDALEKDVQLTIEAGFNGIRKHQKIEDERFYYYCDVLGVLVWCEMPSAYSFGTQAVIAMTEQWTQAVLQNMNHPSVVAWVPFNESWGIPNVRVNSMQQQFTKALCSLTKALDFQRRPVISNDGWEHTDSDIVTVHNYVQDGERLGQIYRDADSIACDAVAKPFRAVHCDGYGGDGPMMISEFGGIAFATHGQEWGYGSGVATPKEYLDRYRSLISAIGALPHVCGYCLTQTTDVFQEVNGILTMDRKPKVPLSELKRINDSVLTGHNV